jgi:hypothetical protein
MTQRSGLKLLAHDPKGTLCDVRSGIFRNDSDTATVKWSPTSDSLLILIPNFHDLIRVVRRHPLLHHEFAPDSSILL